VTQFFQVKIGIGTSLVVQWLRFHASNAGVTGSIPDGNSVVATEDKMDSKNPEHIF